MNIYKLKEITTIVDGRFEGNEAVEFSKILIDSRKVNIFEKTLFFAIPGVQHDGHRYIGDLYEYGIRAFVVCQAFDTSKFPDAGFIIVEDTVRALQKLSGYKRDFYKKPILAITGSNGKTIVKEWIFWILCPYYKIVRSPKSYNSQIGVPLSLWLLNDDDSDLAIIETGISKVGEMKVLADIIKPNIGILTNIGTAHQANFESPEQKTAEKMQLLKNCDTVVLSAANEIINSQTDILEHVKNVITWSRGNDSRVKVKDIKISNNHSNIIIEYDRNFFNIQIPFTDKGSIQNAVICFCTLVALNFDISMDIIKRFLSLPRIKMRLETLDGIYNSIIINDSYNSDINSLEIALDYLNEKKGNKSTILILSDILQSSESKLELCKEISILIKEKKIDLFIGIGKTLSENEFLFPKNSEFFPDTEDFIKKSSFLKFQDKAILLKGARNFKFEKISKRLQYKNHLSVIETDLTIMKENLRTFKSLLKPKTKMMVMVKAFSYGSGYREIAAFLQHNRVDYLAVAFIDEGVELRQYGIDLPIVVMNPNVQSLQTMIEYRLEPEIYSINILKELVRELNSSSINNFPIHIKLDTGMHRLGLNQNDLEEMFCLIKKSKKIKLESVFSHLVGSDCKTFDDFTHLQVEKFNEMYFKIVDSLGEKPLRHIVNSAGIIRFPDYHFEMVRLGIGLYGLIPELNKNLVPVSTFVSEVSQIHRVAKGETIGYDRSGEVKQDSDIATIPLGYADGFNRKLGNGNWNVIINSQKAPTIGNICMDMCMIDITGLNVKEGDKVIIFGPLNPLTKMAEKLDTIPYEVMTSVSQRIKRVYYEE